MTHLHFVRADDRETNSPPSTAVLTLVVWLSCAAVGVLGFAIPYSHPRPQPAPPPPIQAEILNVQLTPEEAPKVRPDNVRQNESPAVPPPIQPQALPAAPPLIAVAEVSKAVAFALPVEGPVQVVPVQEASYAKPEIQPAQTVSYSSAAAVPNVPQRLTYGQGEGRQPAPEYPRRALTAGQEGTVVVRFSVGERGQVLTAEAASASPWPLLNEAAVRVVRERWRFATGAMRLYEVAIRFQLEK